MAKREKPLVWLQGQVKTPPFSKAARLETGFLLRRLQKGEAVAMPHARPMPSIGVRCWELRVRDAQHNWRLFYRIDPDAIVIRLPRAAGSLRRSLEESTMKKAKRTRLERSGWKVGTAREFLGLSDEEARFLDVKLALARALRRKREREGLSQAALAKRIESSQSRVAKIEAGDQSVTLDLIVRSLLAMGTSPRELARIISGARQAA